MTRIGHGFDAHRLVDGRSMILGGVRVPFERGPLAHSDCDVLAHAIADAILGGAALGQEKDLTPKERLEGLSPEERLEGLPPEELLKRLSREEIENYLKRLKNGSPPASAPGSEGGA